jgi:hypothetical protein
MPACHFSFLFGNEYHRGNCYFSPNEGALYKISRISTVTQSLRPIIGIPGSVYNGGESRLKSTLEHLVRDMVILRVLSVYKA